MVKVTFQITDDSEHNRNEKCLDILADIQEILDKKIAEFNRKQQGDAKFVEICQELGKYLDSHDEDIKDCHDGQYAFIYEFIKSYFKDELAKYTNYMNCIDKWTSEKKYQIEKEHNAEEAQRAAEDGKQQLRDPVKEGPAKSECGRSPCGTEHSENQAGEGKNQDNSVNGVSGHTGQEETKSAVHVEGHQEVGNTHPRTSIPLEGRTNEDSVLNGKTHARDLEKGSGLSVDAPGITIIAQQRRTSAIYLNVGVTKVHEPEIDQSNHTARTNLSGIYFNFTSGELTLSASHPSVGEETSTDLSSSHGVSPYSQHTLPGGISSASEKNSLDSLSLSVSTFPVVQVSSAEQQLPTLVRLPPLEPTSDHERELQNKSSQEQINSQGAQLSESNVDGMDKELSTPMQEEQTTSIKTYLIIILSSLGAMLLSVLLIKFTSVGAYFRRKKNEKRQKMREELDRIMYTPSNFEEDNIYLSYSQPEYSSYYAEYDN